MYVVIDPAGHPQSFHSTLWAATRVITDVEVGQERPDIADMFDIYKVTGRHLLYYRIYKLCVIIKYRIWQKLIKNFITF